MKKNNYRVIILASLTWFRLPSCTLQNNHKQTALHKASNVFFLKTYLNYQMTMQAVSIAWLSGGVHCLVGGHRVVLPSVVVCTVLWWCVHCVVVSIVWWCPMSGGVQGLAMSSLVMSTV